MKTKTGGVIFTIHVRTPYQFIPKLFITEIPENITASELQDDIEEAGYIFSEFGVKWANHSVVSSIKDEHIDVRRAFKNNEVETISYSELQKKIKEYVIE